MTRRRILQAGMAFLLSLCLTPAIAADDKGELKKRFQARYPTLLRLKNAGKVGETPSGELLVVKAAFANEKVDPKNPKSKTIAEFLALENTDRQRLYALIAKERKEEPRYVAQQNAIRNYKNAAPDHYLQVKNKEGKLVWKKRKEIKEK